ncbi:MAG: PIN domain-containing protein [Cyanobacteria bacterium REEB65]|nr:PIN domain-containing protein [Cyanobacteria bacterium REEB65]
MILVDAGPLIALINKGDADHDLCLGTLKGLPTPLLTSWTAFSEAMHVLGELGRRAGGGGKWRAQNALWELLDTAAIEVAEPSTHLLERMRALMEKYQDTPMDLGDASLVALAEERRITRIFSLDDDFHVYRVGTGSFEIVPKL